MPRVLFKLGLILRSVCNCGSEDSNLSVKHLTARPADGLAALDARLEVKHREHVLVKLLMQVTEVLQREVVQLALPRLRERDRSS